MANVQRSPMTNYRGRNQPGAVRFVIRKGAPVRYRSDRRPEGTSEGQPDMNRAARGVRGSDRQQFQQGRAINRRSVYNVNTSGDSGGNWDGPRSRTRTNG